MKIIFGLLVVLFVASSAAAQECTVVSNTNTTIELAWDPSTSADVTETRIFVSSTPGGQVWAFPTPALARVFVPNTQVTIDATSLTEGKNYFIALASDVDGKFSAPSNEVCLDFGFEPVGNLRIIVIVVVTP